MARQDEVEQLLTQVAPLFREVSLYAQNAARELHETPWAEKYLARTAAFNQVSGTARWRVAGDQIVLRKRELPTSIELTTNDGEQNQGRYYLGAPDQAIVFTIRRKPHAQQTEILQMQMETVLAQAPIAYDDAIAAYLAIPPEGEPYFDVITGKAKVTYFLWELIAKAQGNAGNSSQGEASGPVVALRDPEQDPPPAGPKVSSSKKRSRGARNNQQG